MNATNSCHTNSADEPFTTPSEEWIRLAAHAQAILLEESGLFKHMMNTLSGSPGMKAVERAVEAAILEEFREIDRLGGVLAAVEAALSAQPDPTRRPSLRTANLRRHAPNHRIEQVPRRR